MPSTNREERLREFQRRQAAAAATNQAAPATSSVAEVPAPPPTSARAIAQAATPATAVTNSGMIPPPGTTVAAPMDTPSARTSPLPAPPRGQSSIVVDTGSRTNAADGPPPEEMIPAGTIHFPATDINQVLQVYAELVNRTILRPTALPAPTITLRTTTPLTKQEAVQALDAVLAMNGIAMINVGDKFVKAVPVAQANQEGAPFNKLGSDQLPELGPYVTHVVQLKYTRPTELVQALQPFAKIPNAILPIDSSQIIVLRDYTENVKRMLEMIKEIDVTVPSEYISEVIPIKYALASEIASALNALSSGGGATSVGSSGTGTGARTGTTGRSTFGGGSGMQNRSGMGMGMNQMGTMSTMGTTTPGMTPSSTGSFSDRLQQIIRRASVSGEITILGQTKIIADERTNALLIFASKDDMKMIKDVVSKLDVVLAQVLIEAVVIEVNLRNDKDIGFSYLETRMHGDGKYRGIGAIGGTSFFNPSDFIASGSTNAGRALSGGFNYFGRWNNDLEMTVTAVASDSRARILQRPRIQTSHAVEANLFVGESRPYPTASYYGGGAYGGYSSIQQLQIGVTLSVTPLINPDGLVVMDIHQTIESANGSVNIVNVGEVPITSRKEAAAKVAVRDRDTIMLGGLIESGSSTSGSGVPYLKDLPVLGFLFRSNSSNQNRNELIVLIRPTVLPTPEVAALTATAEKDKMPGVRRAEIEIMEDEARRLKQSQRLDRMNN